MKPSFLSHGVLFKLYIEPQYSTLVWRAIQSHLQKCKKNHFPPYSNIAQYQFFLTLLVGKCMFLPHSLFHCLVHIQFSSFLVQEANPLHSQELDTELLPSAAHTPRPRSAGSGCTTIQQTGVKLQTACKPPLTSQTLSLNLSHIIKLAVLMPHMLSPGYLSNV